MVLGEQLGGKRTVLFLDTKAGSIREQLGEQLGGKRTAAAGALVRASSEVQMILALLGGFWICAAQLSEANSADVPSKK